MSPSRNIPVNQLLNVTQAAKHVGYARQHLYKLISQGAFPKAEMIAGNPCYDIATLDAWKASHGKPDAD